MAPDGFSYEFRDPELLRLARTHASTGTGQDNERLEFLGDAVLDLIVAEELFRRVPELPEGNMTQRKASVVSRRSLTLVARSLALADDVQLGGGLRGRTVTASVLANFYEALVGAIYLDGGLEAARVFVRETLAAPLACVSERDGEANPKQALQQLSQARWSVLPSYELIDSRGEAHARAFLVAAKIGERRFPSAWGRTRKEAESWAAHEAMLVLADEGARSTH